MKNRLFILILSFYSMGVLAQNKAVFTLKADKPSADVSPNAMPMS